MKNLSVKNKIFIALAAVVILVWSYFASGGKPTAKPEETAVLTETVTETAALTDTEETTEYTEKTDTEATEESTAEAVTESVSETTSESLIETTSVRTVPQTEKKTETTTLQPVTKAEVHSEKTADTCTFSVSCATILNNLDDFDKNKLSLLPSDGVIYAPKTVEFTDGESVFDVLLREMRANGIHMEFSKVPAYNSVYVEGINNIYEFDCGELSGWEYRVNGEHPRYGCDLYKLHDGDVVEWLYTCDLGRDIGDTYYAQ